MAMPKKPQAGAETWKIDLSNFEVLKTRAVIQKLCSLRLLKYYILKAYSS